MASPFFQAWADWISGLNGLASESSGSAKLIRQHDESLNGIGPESRSRRTSERSMPDGVKATAWDSLNHAESDLVPTLGQNTGMATGRAGVIAFTQNQRDEIREVEVPGALASQPGMKQQTYLSISSAEGSLAKTSPSPATGQDLTGNDQDCSSKQPESLTLFSDPEGGSSLRTFPDFFPQTVDEISPSFSRRWPTSGFMTSPGECWTADTSECPSGGGVFSSLPDVLEATVPNRFFLSPKAAAGILRRARKRGRDLPEPLESALTALATRSQPDQPLRKMEPDGETQS